MQIVEIINSGRKRSRPPPFPAVQPADGRSYPIGQRPQSAGGQDVAEKGNRTTAPRGGATHAATERIQTAAESQTGYLEPDYHNEMRVMNEGGETRI